MKISDYRSDYYLFTGKASEIVRQLALAGIAVVWIFKDAVGSNIHLPIALVIPSVGFLASIALDLAQYFTASIIWKNYYRELEERELPAEAGAREEYDFGMHDTAKEKPITILFYVKIGVTAVSWCWLVGVLIGRLVP